MILSRNHLASCCLGGVVALSFSTVAVDAGEPSDHGSMERSADHCGRFGADFVDMGSGVCARISRHVRIYVRPLGAFGQSAGWPAAGTSSAALRSYEPGLLPGSESTQHLRVRGSLDGYGPYR